MTAKQWLNLMQQAENYNPAMTSLIKKYGEMLVQEQCATTNNLLQETGDLLADAREQIWQLQVFLANPHHPKEKEILNKINNKLVQIHRHLNKKQ